MKISERGVINCGEPGHRRAASTFPSVVPISNGSLLACYRVGSTKDTDDETIELRRSYDGGRTWSDPVAPFERSISGRRGSLKLGYVTPISRDHLIMAALWVDREAYPGQPLFNEKTEGLLPTRILLADSHDVGNTWSGWRVLHVPEEIGPPSLTNPILRLPSGRLVVSIETNKNYEDRCQWRQRVVYFYSEDLGQTWNTQHTVSQDKSGRILNWGQRTGIGRDGQLVSFTWTYDRETGKYLNVHRRLSYDEGSTWTLPEDLGFADQPSHPAMLPDGRVILAWVDRFQSRSIRARLSEGADRPFLPETQLILHERPMPPPEEPAGQAGTGDLLAEMGMWDFGLPFAQVLPDNDAMVVYYEGDASSLQVSWVRLTT